uniref:GH01937p n=1 Tax=Drosophila melanogaster TaxID=7227 RepID=Q8MRR5_DROME|nr:GH01937p [Drosophila melanogaster]
MLLLGLKYALLLAITGCFLVPIHGSGSDTDQVLPHRIYRLLDRLSGGGRLSASSTFALLLSQFLIKQKLRYVAPTRYERQLYYHLLHRMEHIRRGSGLVSREHGVQGEILSIAFQANVLLLPPSLKLGELNANGEYEQLAEVYPKVVNEGQLNRTQSDLCLRDIVELKPPHCKLLSGECLELLASDAPAYGYQRTHQVLLLYVLEHQACAPHLSPPQVYELLAKSQCDEVEREQNAIRSLGLPVVYRDLYLEQATICGLFGYNEFVNWRNVMEIGSWLEGDSPKDMDVLADDGDSQHISDLALVFYTNALLLLH